MWSIAEDATLSHILGWYVSFGEIWDQILIKFDNDLDLNT